MYTCSIENEYGERLTLTNNRNYTLYQIDGLEPPAATINTSTVANFDGSRFNSARTNERNIVIYLTIEGDCEQNRIDLYKYVKTKRWIRFYYTNENRDVYADGYVESIQIGFFDMKQAVQISILCPYPYFKARTDEITAFAALEPMFIFPFAYTVAGAPFSVLTYGAEQSIINEGDIENGVIITLRATGQVLNPKIYNLTKNEKYLLSVDMVTGDEIQINTNAGQKSVTMTHEGVTTNIINSVDIGSNWFQLQVGDNVFTYSADEYPENLMCTVNHWAEYEGV